MRIWSFYLFLFFLNLILCNEKYIGIIKTCSGWRLNKLPEVKEFLKNYVDEYPIEVVFSGGDPRLIIMNYEGDEIEQISLVHKTRNEIEELLKEKGFNKFN